MENYSLSDISAVMGKDGFMGGNCSWLIILFLIIFGGGFGNRFNDGIGNYATAASQQEILFGQHFQNIDNKIDRLANGLCDSTYALNNAITGEGRAMQNQLAQYSAQTLAAIHADGEATRALINGNEMQRLREELSTAKANLNNAAQSNYLLSQIGKWYSNPPCYGTGCGCACGNV